MKKAQNFQQHNIFQRSGDESWRREVECPIPEIEHDPRKYCPNEWPCHLKSKYCDITECDEPGPVTASFNSMMMTAILGCIILGRVSN